MRNRTILTSAAALACLAVASVATQAATVVVPNTQTAALGNGQTQRPFDPLSTTGTRFQQVYGADQFGSFNTVELINSFSFRAKQPSFVGNSLTVSNVTIKLSTTQRDATIDGPNGISGDLSMNPGVDALTVYTGPLTLTAPTIGQVDSYYTVTLQTPFAYSKALGNLLLEVSTPAGTTVVGNGFNNSFSQFDTVTGTALGAGSNDGVASVFQTNPSGGTIGANTTTGLVTRFTTVVPEPTTLAALASLGTLALRRRKA